MKYKLTDDTIDFNGRTLHRIECVEAFGDVKVGDKGGYIEKTDNLSQFGNAWVYGNAWVCDNAWVYGNAWVYDSAKVYGNAEVYDDCVYCNEVDGNKTINDEELKKFIENYAERMMHIHCREHNLDTPNHIIKDAFRIGFGDGIKKALELWK